MARIKLIIAALFMASPLLALADQISIDFDELNDGVDVSMQYYDSFGVAFQSGFTDADSPGQIVTTTTDPFSSLEASVFDGGIYILFSSPIYSVSVSVFEYEEGGEEEYYEEGEEEYYEEGEEEYYEEDYSVYIVAYDSDLSELILGDNFVHSVGIWSQLSVSELSGIGAIRLWGTQDFKIDEIIVETTRSVPEPSTLALLGIGLFGMGMARRGNKA